MREKNYLVIISNNNTNNYLLHKIEILFLMLIACSHWHPWLYVYSTNQQHPNTTSVIKNNSNLIARNNNSSQSSPSLAEQSILVGSCNGYSTCKAQANYLSSAKRSSNCKCDSNCSLYGDCCSNSNSTTQITFSQKNSTNDKSIRKEWYCYKVNNSSGNIIIKAKCPNDWLIRNNYSQTAKLTQKNCEFAKFINNNHNHDEVSEWETTVEPQKDPMGMMMPITDLVTGITFANSHCLLCNRKYLLSLLSTISLDEQHKSSNTNKDNEQISSREATYNDNKKPLQPKLIYWTPSLECNYLENDERNAIYDLIKTNKGQALEYSSIKKRWIIKKNITSTETSNQNQNKNKIIIRDSDTNDTNILTDNQDNQDLERVCNISPIVPDPVDNTLRFCEPNIIDECKPQQYQKFNSDFISIENYNKAKLECNSGYQAIVYSEDTGLSYFNLGCARCNYEKRISCRPMPALTSWNKHHVSNSSVQQYYGYSPPVDVPTIITNQQHDLNNATSGLARTIHPGGSLVSASISILFDIYPSSHGDVEVGFLYQCPENQVFDPFYSKCMDSWNCGPNRKLIDDECKEIDADNSSINDDDNNNRDVTTVSYHQSLPIKEAANSAGLKWVAKFNFTMANLTAIGLMISIISLSIYLCLYILSTFDLRPLVIKMANYNHNNDQNKSPSLDRIRLSRESDSYSSKSAHIGDRSQNLASRGVACLAASLLAAYILFILGHRQQSSSHNNNSNETHNSYSPVAAQPSLTCFLLAIGTYYFFLNSFNWMFLLSFDIWRILRLATCQLQKPSTKTQSTRFIIYTTLAMLSAAILVSSAVIFDLIPINCQQNQASNEQTLTIGIGSSNCITNDRISQFIYDYRPKFGYRINSCWFTNRRALAMFFGIPVSLIMFLNLIFFVHSSYMVIKSSTKPPPKKAKHSKSSSSSSTSSSSPSTSRWFTGFSILKKGTTSLATKESTSEITKLSSVVIDTKDEQNKKCKLTRLNSLTTISVSSSSDDDNQQQQSKHSNNDDYTNQNELTTSSFTSVQTLQSNISASTVATNSASCTGLGTCSGEDFSCCAGKNMPVNESPRILLPYATSAGPEGAPSIIKVMEENKYENRYKRSSPPPLESTQSSNSLTNQSVSGVSITASLAMKYDTSKQNITLVMNSIGKDYRLYMRLSTIMGLTWFFGLIASIVDQSYLLWYLFIILNTLQGLFIFIAFGCKKSKLANVYILINYMQFRWSEIRSKGYHSTS